MLSARNVVNLFIESVFAEERYKTIPVLPVTEKVFYKRKILAKV